MQTDYELYLYLPLKHPPYTILSTITMISVHPFGGQDATGAMSGSSAGGFVLYVQDATRKTEELEGEKTGSNALAGLGEVAFCWTGRILRESANWQLDSTEDVFYVLYVILLSVVGGGSAQEVSCGYLSATPRNANGHAFDTPVTAAGHIAASKICICM